MSALAQVVMALAWAASDAPDANPFERQAAPEPKPPLGATLILPRPRTLPCERFQTVAIEAGADEAHLSYDEGASVSWRAAGRDWSFVASIWRQPPAPLRRAAFPTRVRFSTTTPHRIASLTFYCRRYDMSDKGMLRRDSDAFLGVRWVCTADGCRTNAGYALPWSLARSRRRLRLCEKTPAETWDDRNPGTAACRDAAPAFEDRQKALALGAELVADARRVIQDACRPAGVCDPREQASLMKLVRPGNWQLKDWSGLPVGLKLSAVDGERGLDLDCSSHMGDVHCNLTLREGAGPVMTYMAIDNVSSPAEAVLYLDKGGSGILLTAASGELYEHEPGGCDVSVPLLSVR